MRERNASVISKRHDEMRHEDRMMKYINHDRETHSVSSLSEVIVESYTALWRKKTLSPSKMMMINGLMI